MKDVKLQVPISLQFIPPVCVYMYEMQFLDITLTKDSSLLLYDVHSPFYWRIFKKIVLFSGFKNSYKKIRETRELYFLERKIWLVENQTKTWIWDWRLRKNI